MLLERTEIDTGLKGSPVTVKGASSAGESLEVQLRSAFTHGALAALSEYSSDNLIDGDGHDTISPSDGLRLFEQSVPLAPLERDRFQHMQVESTLQVRQLWEGVVTDVNFENEEFTARLHNITTPGDYEREVTLDMQEVSANDRDLMREGGIFQWMIGYRRKTFGQMERVSAIVFRRLPVWYEEDITNAHREGEALAAAFSVE